MPGLRQHQEASMLRCNKNKMVNNRKAQAAFEYLTTYGWAILTAIIVTGALAYFGFLNPSSLLPNKCDFGKQLECVDYRIMSNGDINLRLRNNFGKDITVTDVEGIEVLVQNKNIPLSIPSGATQQLSMTLDSPYRMPAGEKQDVALIIVFERAGVSNPASHNISGSLFVTVQ